MFPTVNSHHYNVISDCNSHCPKMELAKPTKKKKKNWKHFVFQLRIKQWWAVTRKQEKQTPWLSKRFLGFISCDSLKTSNNRFQYVVSQSQFPITKIESDDNQLPAIKPQVMFFHPSKPVLRFFQNFEAGDFFRFWYKKFQKLKLRILWLWFFLF